MVENIEMEFTQDKGLDSQFARSAEDSPASAKHSWICAEDQPTSAEHQRVSAEHRICSALEPRSSALQTRFVRSAEDSPASAKHSWICAEDQPAPDRKSTRLNSSHVAISYAV